MPGMNNTGPRGQGPRTGRGMGNCKAADQSNSNNNRSFGRGRNNSSGQRTNNGQGRRCSNRWAKGQDVNADNSLVQRVSRIEQLLHSIIDKLK